MRTIFHDILKWFAWLLLWAVPVWLVSFWFVVLEAHDTLETAVAKAVVYVVGLLLILVLWGVCDEKSRPRINLHPHFEDQ